MLSLRQDIAKKIDVVIPDTFPRVSYEVLDSVKENGYTRNYIVYDSYGDKVTAFLLIPENSFGNPAILINHQHNGERHLGKSEVCGLAGNPLQAFGPELVKKGFVVLAPDSICFEERRKNAHGTEPLSGDGDFLQHYNEMCYRILKGETLAKKVISDAMNGITLLSNLEFVDKNKIGTLGHSYGGNTVLFLSALDERISFSCASGSGCTYENRMLNNVGIEMASVIPEFTLKYDMPDLVRCIAPRRLLVVSADDDKYSKDADVVIQKAKPSYSEYMADDNLCHMRYSGGHALTKERFDYIVDWLTNCTDSYAL
jgi:dienelactone hydrolase